MFCPEQEPPTALLQCMSIERNHATCLNTLSGDKDCLPCAFQVTVNQPASLLCTTLYNTLNDKILAGSPSSWLFSRRYIGILNAFSSICPIGLIKPMTVDNFGTVFSNFMEVILTINSNQATWMQRCCKAGFSNKCDHVAESLLLNSSLSGWRMSRNVGIL